MFDIFDNLHESLLEEEEDIARPPRTYYPEFVVEVEGQSVSCLFDTGAEVSGISAEFVELLHRTGRKFPCLPVPQLTIVGVTTGRARKGLNFALTENEPDREDTICIMRERMLKLGRRRQEKQKHKHSDFQIGGLVILREAPQSDYFAKDTKKLELLFTGPCVMTNKLGKNSYEIQNPDSLHIKDLEPQTFYKRVVLSQRSDYLQQPPSSKAPKKQPTYAPQTCHSTALSLNAISVKEDTHLIATIRGLHSEMSLKDREIHKLGKELEEAKRMVRKLQKDRDKLLDKDTNNLVKSTRTKASSKNDKPEPALEDKGLDVDSQSSLKPYNPVRFQFPQDGEEGISALRQQNQTLRRDLLQVEEEYRRLKTKRMQDLNLLQQQHELEMEQVVSEHMARHSGSRIAELQGQLGTQRMVIAQLKEQLKQLDEYREEIVVLKTERNLLEKSAIELNKKLTTLRSLQTPEALHYEALQDKIQELESRHEFREQKLQAVVKDLLRRNAEQRAHLAEREQNVNSVNLREKLMDKNRELCLYQAEMDRILDTLRSLYRCRGPNNFSE
uniref:Centrosomal protein of 162 kDa n=1 Tax=Timema genevievae TaxID=629358 RepID=A0A7R9PMJ4_TIMGE|nr:unnamed protein product [Timema genevievae]